MWQENANVKCTFVFQRSVARPAGGRGGAKFQNEIFLSLVRAGGPNLEKVDTIYTRGENFSKKVF